MIRDDANEDKKGANPRPSKKISCEACSTPDIIICGR